MTTRPVTQADVACAYRDRIAEPEGQLAAARLALAAVRDVKAAGTAARATEMRSDGTGAPE